MISISFVLENCIILGYYAASHCNILPTFQDNLLVPSSGFKNKKKKACSPDTEFI